MTEVRVEALHVGDITMPRAYAFRPSGNPLEKAAALVRGGTLRSPLLAFVVRHPEAGALVVDTGLHGDAIRSVRADYGAALGGVMFRGLRPVSGTFDEQLRAVGVDAGDVKLAVMTHLHVDHTSGMRLLPAAEFVVAREEWKAATGSRPTLGGYVPTHLPPAHRVRQVDFSQGEAHGPFARTIDLLGDGSVRLVSTPGHTPGHLSVLLRAEGGREVLLAGDAAYTRESIRDQVLPLMVPDADAYRRSLRELKDFVDAAPDATVVPTHDPDAWRVLAPRPEAQLSGAA